MCDEENGNNCIINTFFNRSTFDSTVLEQISKTLNIQGNLEEKMFGELLELSKAQTDQVTRTVAYSTNQVIKLHQDITDISYTLKGIKYIAPNGHEPSNTTVSISIQLLIKLYIDLLN